jgi:nucleoside-diphosphate-sugar epimerase
VAARVDAGMQGLGYYSQAAHVLSELNKTIACSIQLSRQVLGYEPTVGLEEGMDRSVAWCLQEGLEL